MSPNILSILVTNLIFFVYSIAAVWDAHATLYHGYEICGLEHLPKDSNGLLIYYHGAIPIDMYYFVAKIYLKYDRLIYTVGDRFLFKLPGWKVSDIVAHYTRAID
jgi:hypothetical protein